MSLAFSIAAASDVPIYRQIIHHIHRCVVLGSLQPGEQLPAVRSLAEFLIVNPNTVARAYQELIREGVAESRSGVGVYITTRRQVFSDEEKSRRLNQFTEQLVHEALFLQFSRAQTQALVEKKWSDVEQQISRTENPST